MKKNNNIIIVGFLVIIIIIGIIYFVLSNNKATPNGPSDSSVKEIDTNINTDDGDEKIDWDDYETFDITLSESIEIKDEGIYNLTGTISNGNIKVNTSGNVKLNLNNINITSSNGPCIYIEQASDVVINISGTNYLTDSDNYNGLDEDVNGVIYSKDDITFDGNGKLVIKANYADGIVSKDDLKIINGNYEITSVDDGIRGKDSVYILDGNFIINSSSDGIKSTNDTDEEKGYILIKSGTFDIESGFDGIQSETKLVIDGGTFNIKSGGGSINSSSSNSGWGRWPGYFEESNNTNNDSAKGLKSGNNLVINNGAFILDTSDDAIHSNNYVGIKNGTFDINSGDDGIHADMELIIDGGTIDINKSYEGLEASKITINGGEFNITSSDDGINVAGGVDSSATNRPGENHFNNSSDNVLTINSGSIAVNATGDGIDVNGEAYMYDGKVIVYGPTNSGNGALDYDSIFEVNGGTIIASGSSGMAQSFSNSSKIYQVHIGFSNTITSSDIVTITDSNNKEIIKFQSAKTYSSLVIALSQFKKGSTYKIMINSEQYETFTISSNETLVGSNGVMFPSGGGNRPQGGPGGRR